MAPATRRAIRDATNLLTATPDEAAIIIACALANPKDLLRLARACRRFAIKCIPAHRTAATSGGGTAAAAQQAVMWSISEEAARRRIADCTDQGARLGAAPRSGELAGSDVGGAVAASWCCGVRSVTCDDHAVRGRVTGDQDGGGD